MVELGTRSPPHSLEAEKGVLGSVLLFEDMLDGVSQSIEPGMFYLDCHGKIFQVILELRKKQVPVDPVTVSQGLQQRGWLDDIGGVEYLVDLAGFVPHAAHANYYAGIVRNESLKRKLIYTATDILRDTYEGNFEAGELIESAEQRIGKLLDTRQGGGRWLSEHGRDAIERITSVDQVGISCGFPDVDSRIGGLKPNRLIIIAARPGMGKTSFVENVIEHVARHVGPVAFFSLEMGEDSVFDRLLIARLGIPLNELSLYANRNFDSTLDAVTDISQLPVFVNAAPHQSVASMLAQSRVIQRTRGLKLVVVDYLTLIDPEDKRASRETQVGMIAQNLAKMAKTLGVPVICLAQLNRECERRPDRRPSISDIRDSGQIEQAADVIGFLFRPAVYFPEKHKAKEAHLIIAKNRDGQPGSVMLNWNGSTMTFSSGGDDFDPVDEF